MKPKELKRIREEEFGLTQTQLAEHMGVTRETITRWEIGTREIPLIAEKLLAFLKASKGSLLKS
jgi:DNA-binding transcriptional regulator YiaG